MNRKTYVGFETHRLLLFKLHYGMVPAVFVILLAAGSAAPRLIAQTPAPKFAVLYAFEGHVSDGDGINPVAPLQIGRDGVLYGTTYQGGTQATPCYLGCGTAFSLTPTSHGLWKETQLHRFASGGDGFEPSTLTISPSGVLYGTTSGGGQKCGTGCGTAFSLSPPASPRHAWHKTTYAFQRSETVLPDSLRFAAGGLLYGTSLDGGFSQNCPQFGCGSFFLLTPPRASSHLWTESRLYKFAGQPDNQHGPIMTVAGANGVVYGTSEGGSLSCPFGCGLVFSLSPPSVPGGSWTETVLHAFSDQKDDGAGAASIVIGPQGVLYGTTGGGGTAGWGTVFSLTPPTAPGGSWTEKILYNFTGAPDAGYPNTGLVIGKNGVLYDTSSAGGDSGCQMYGCGTVFSLTPPASPGGSWTETVLHAFSGGDDGGLPRAGPMIGGSGVLYGSTTAYGPVGKYGTVFALMP
jgi:uncharacterized repeat protein (TIGR03803 family)